MKALHGHLPINTKYKLLDVYIGGEGEYQTCENCGNIIKNVATVESNEQVKYNIGMDCAFALTTQLNNFSMSDLEVMNAKKRLQSDLRFIKAMKTEAKTILIDETKDLFWFFRSDVSKWEHYFRGRGKYSKFKHIIGQMDVKKVYEVFV